MQNDLIEPETVTEPEVDQHSSGRPKRSALARRLPGRYQDKLPPAPVEVFQQETHENIPSNAPVISDAMEVDDNRASSEAEAHKVRICHTKKDAYGIYHSFLHSFPSFVPRGASNFICDSSNLDMGTPKRNWWAGFTTSRHLNGPDLGDEASMDDSWWAQYKTSLTELDYFAPFPNPSTYLLMNWFYSNSSSKSLGELDKLVKTVILDEDFDSKHLAGFNAMRETQRLDNIQDTGLSETFFKGSDGWHKTSVEISVPFEFVQNKSESEAPKFKVDSLFFRQPMEVIKAALSNTDTEHFHFYPHKTYWQPDATKQPERVYSELYNSDAYIEEHDRIRSAHADSEHEVVITALMLWSDSTQLANFGAASLWPIYVFLGN